MLVKRRWIAPLFTDYVYFTNRFYLLGIKLNCLVSGDADSYMGVSLVRIGGDIQFVFSFNFTVYMSYNWFM